MKLHINDIYNPLKNIKIWITAVKEKNINELQVTNI